MVPDDTKIGILYDILLLLHPVTVGSVLLSFVFGFCGGVWIYMSLGIKTAGELRKKSFATAIGFIVWLASVVGGNLF